MDLGANNKTGQQILVVDDDVRNRDILIKTLEPHGYRMQIAPSGEIALRIIPDTPPDLILLDIMMPGLNGFEVCKRLKADESTRDIPVIFVTARDETVDVIKGFRLGGVDYITKPFMNEEVLVRVETHLKINQLTRQLSDQNTELQAANEQLRREIEKREQAEDARQKSDERLDLIVQQESFEWGIEGFIGQSQTVAKILGEVHQLQGVHATGVLITGESGTGKELIARAIHFGGTRKDAPFVPVNCSAIPSELAESILFGHIKGAFTGAAESRKGCFELADGGTLFLDEIGDMPPTLQVKLLRVLDSGCFTSIGGAVEKQVDVRILAATNADLRTKIADGEFREDLYFRLARFTVTVPPLRERVEDIPLLVAHFRERFATEMGMGQAPALSARSLSTLEAYHFPGNVRELKNIIEGALILNRGGDIQPEHLRLIELNGSSPHRPPIPAPKPTEEERILAYLRQHGSISNSECHQLLNVDRNRAFYLFDKMQAAGLIRLEGSRRWARYYLIE